MKKSAYSLILMDEVVSKIDELAYVKGNSRSGLINQILADHLSLKTPQRYINEIFASISKAAASEEIIPMRPSDHIIQFKSALNTRYNPKIKYSVEILPEKGRYICEFKVASRTQSDALLAGLTAFYEIWVQIEHGMLKEKREGELRSSISGGQFRRPMRIESNGKPPYNAALLGASIGQYIKLFDQELKTYFPSKACLDMQTFDQMQKFYEAYLKNAQIII